MLNMPFNDWEESKSTIYQQKNDALMHDALEEKESRLTYLPFSSERKDQREIATF